MKPPFTVDEFLEIFKNYNQAVYPIQFIFYVVSIYTIYIVVKPVPKSDKIISIILSFFWLWMGIVYHLIFFTTINVSAYLFAGVFILQGIFFLIYGAFLNRLSFRFRSNLYGITGIILIIYAMIIYPILGYFLGHSYPVSPTFGLPCPTTIFTFGLLLLNAERCPITILIIPFLWSIIGFAAAFYFGIAEDTGLIVAGIIAFSLLLFRNSMLRKKDSAMQI